MKPDQDDLRVVFAATLVVVGVLGGAVVLGAAVRLFLFAAGLGG
jgi:hypothetical protein